MGLRRWRTRALERTQVQDLHRAHVVAILVWLKELDGLGIEQKGMQVREHGVEGRIHHLRITQVIRLVADHRAEFLTRKVSAILSIGHAGRDFHARR